MTVKLREDYQVPTVDDFIDYLVSGKGLTPLTALPTGCHGWDTPIRMFDHSIKMVQDVIVGDLLRGDDGNPRKVLELYRGHDHLFKVGQAHGASYVVNSVHVLVTLGEGNAIIEQPVTTMMRDAHNWKGSASAKRIIPQQYTPPLFGTDEVELTEDSCELDILRADPPSRAKLVAIVLRDRKLRGSKVLTLFCHNQDELERFTILFRAEGYGTRVQQMPLGSGKQVLLELHGEGTALPDTLGRYIEERNLASFEYMGMGEYYGFSIDGNQRYRLGDLTITHNTGKSLVMAGGIQRLRQMWAARVLVLTHVKELVEQDARAIALLNKEPIGINCDKLKKRDFRQPIIVGTVGSVSSMIDKIGKVHVCVVDECFPGDVEILTATGFKRFDKLNDTDIVAQVDNTLKLSFCKPELIAAKPATPVVRLHSAQAIDLHMTSGHQLMLYRKADGVARKVAVTDAAFNSRWSLPTAASATAVSDTTELTAYERYAIAFQADGNYHNKGSRASQITAFTFSKPRKITAFRVLLELGGWVYREEEVGGGVSVNVKNRTRFFVYGAPHVTKDVASVFNLTEMSADKARKIIEYMNIWDGHVASKNTYLFTNTDKRATDFYQAVAVLAGYTARQRKVVDKRSDNFSDVHRLSIVKQQFISTQLMKVDVNVAGQPDKVYCVRVPDGNIVVRSNGATVVTGNCHRISNNNETQYRKIIAALKEQCPNMVVWGLTATAYRNGQGLLTDGEHALFDGFATDLTQGDKFTWFIDQGYLVDVIPRAVTNELDVSGVGTNSSGEFMESQLISAIDREDVTKAALAEAATSIIKAYACMIFAVGKHHANTIQEILLRDYGVASVVVLGDTDDNERTEAFSMFKTGRVNVLINCGVATTGFDYPEVDLLVVLRATHSASLYTQIAGRAMRPVYEKGYDLLTQEGRLAAIAASRKGKAAVMLDFGGNAKRLGEVNNIRLPLPKSARKSGANEPPPGKECPTCHAIVASNTRICRHCNHEFPLTTLKDKSDGSSIIKRGDTIPVEYKAKEVVHVRYASYMKHTGADGLDSLKVVYTTTNGRVITEFLSWYKAVGMTRGWWSDVGATGVGLPASVQDALSHAANLKVPFGLAIVKNGKYTNVNQRLMNAGQLDSFVKREKDKERDSSKAARTIGIPTLF